MVRGIAAFCLGYAISSAVYNVIVSNTIAAGCWAMVVALFLDIYSREVDRDRKGN